MAAVQNQYHAAHRADAEMLAACEGAGIAFAPFFPLGGGRELDDDRLAEVAARHEASVAQTGLAWLLASSPVTLAIPGTGSIRHLEENMAAGSVALPTRTSPTLPDQHDAQRAAHAARKVPLP